MLNAKLTFLSPQLHDELNRIRGVHGFGTADNVLFEIRTAIKGISCADAVKQIEKLLAPLPAAMKGWFHVCVDGGYLSFGINSPIARLSGMEPVDPLLDVVTGEVKADQCINFNIRLATSPQEIFESGDPLIMCLLKGFAVDVKLHLWKKLSDIVMKIIETGEIGEDMVPFIGGLSPLLLLKMNAHVDLEIDEKMKEAVQNNPMAEPLMMDAPTLIMSASQVHSDEDEEFDEFLKERFDSLQVETIKFFCEHLGDEIDISACHSRAGIKARLTAKGGLSQVFKNIIKFQD